MISEFAKEKVFWTKKMNLKLVKFIESRPYIWNPKHPKYTSVEIRDQTYSEFASKYGNEFTGQAVKDRWTNIRSSFANYLRKISASRTKEDGEEYKVNWHLWEACQFLMKVNRKVIAESSTSDVYVDEGEYNNDDILPEEQNCTSEDDYLSEKESTDTNSRCNDIASSLLQVFKGVQNDAFGIDHSKHGQLGRTVAKKLSEMNSYDAAKASKQIMDVLLLYDKDNVNNPNGYNYKSECFSE